MREFTEVAGRIEAASKPEDLFGDPNKWDSFGRSMFRDLSRVCHPDIVDPVNVDRATVVFARLAELWSQAEQRIGHSTSSEFTVTTKRRTYRASAPIITLKTARG